MSKLVHMLIIGAPASGKGTISSRIVSKFQIQHLSSGDLLRLQIKNKTPLGEKARSFIESGQLVPDDLMINFMLSELKPLTKRSWLLDGFPRTSSQAQKLWQFDPLDIAINLNVPFDVIINRVKNRLIHLASGRVYNIGFNEPKVPGKDDVTGEDLVQRDDDRPEAIMSRLQIYEKVTEPMLEFYRDKNILHSFSGETTNEIWPQIERFLMEKIATHQ